MTQPHNITIHHAVNGLIVKVGCQTLVFNSTHDFIKELSNYLRDPKETTESWEEAYPALKEANRRPLAIAPPRDHDSSAVEVPSVANYY